MKKFELQKDKTMKVNIHQEQDLMMPTKEGNIKLGKQITDTVQVVDSDKINVLYSFIRNQKEALEGGLEKARKELAGLATIREETVPEEIQVNNRLSGPSFLHQKQ